MKDPRPVVNIYFEQAESITTQVNSCKLYYASKLPGLLKMQSHGKLPSKSLAQLLI